MKSDNFTVQAAVLWATIPAVGKERILKNVFCSKCMTAVEIVDFVGEEKRGDIYLTGKCKECGTPVARVVEASERQISHN